MMQLLKPPQTLEEFKSWIITRKTFIDDNFENNKKKWSFGSLSDLFFYIEGAIARDEAEKASEQEWKARLCDQIYTQMFHHKEIFSECTQEEIDSIFQEVIANTPCNAHHCIVEKSLYDAVEKVKRGC